MACNGLFSQQLPPPLPPGQTSTECVVNLEITDYSSHGKKHKVVISGPQPNQKELIKYKAKSPNKPPGSIKWIAGHDSGGLKGFVDYWKLIPEGNGFQLDGMCTIPNYTMPQSNTDLGNAHGMVMVTENNVTPGATISDVEVFFRKDDRNFNNVPNWFFYWSQLYENELELECIKLFDPTSNTFKPSNNFKIFLKFWDKGPFIWPPKVNSSGGQSATYGECHIASTITFAAMSAPSWTFYPAGPSKFGLPGPKSDGIRYCCSALPPPSERHIVIGQTCGYFFVGKTGATDPEGIEVLSETFFHELEHYKIMYENWKDGYDTDIDTDLDGYNDDWETEVSMSLDPADKFKIGTNDSYTLKSKSTGKRESAGYRYEESRCRNIQTNYSKIFNGLDWSYDPTNKIKGKQWK